MARINLLPWRLERRKKRQTEFFAMLGGAALLAAVVSFGLIQYFDGIETNQKQRNAFLDRQIVEVDKQIKDIENLEAQRASLLQRKQVIEDLQSNRSQMVHLFDELVRTIPEGIRLTSIKQAGQQLTLDGVAQSNARVSAYMRSIEGSGWMKQPDLAYIEQKGESRSMPYQFSLRLTLTSPQKEASENGTDAVALVQGGGQ
jgi:type IV pilus assembly protein PilN